METSISITPLDVRGPFNLHHTMQSGQTSEAPWPQIDGGYWNADLNDGQLVRFEVYPNTDNENPSLNIRVQGTDINEETKNSTKNRLMELFRLNDDLPLFYERFRSDKVSPAFKEFSGLRLMKASNPFESLICSICSQHSSVEQWNKTIRCIRTFLGDRHILPDGSMFHLFPSPEKLAKTSVAKLESCQAGYRAKYVTSVSEMLADGTLDLEKLKRIPYDDAKKQLMEIHGIGPKVADCFLLYGLGQTKAAPVDIWIHRIVPRLYFGGAKMSKEEVGKFLRNRFEEWAGLAQLYLYHYGRIRSKILFPADKKLLP